MATWQATQVQLLLKKNNVESELVFIKSEGDIDTITPLYELGVQGIFTKALDAALLNKKIDIAVHSMKDVPTQAGKGNPAGSGFEESLLQRYSGFQRRPVENLQ